MSDQSLRALAVANERRIGAANVKHELAAGVITLEEALRDDRASRVKMWQLLCARPYWGPCKADRLLRKVHISAHRQVGQLTDSQIEQIVESA